MDSITLASRLHNPITLGNRPSYRMSYQIYGHIVEMEYSYVLFPLAESSCRGSHTESIRSRGILPSITNTNIGSKGQVQGPPYRKTLMSAQAHHCISGVIGQLVSRVCNKGWLLHKGRMLSMSIRQPRTVRRRYEQIQAIII